MTTMRPTFMSLASRQPHSTPTSGRWLQTLNWMMMVLLFGLGWWTNSVAAVPPTTYSLGGLFPFTRSGLAYDFNNPQPLTSYDCYTTAAGCPDSESQRYVAFKYQLDRINADPTILPRTKLVMDVADDQGQPSQGFFRAYDVMNRGNKIVVGPDFSSLAVNAALVATGFQVPLISYAASSPALANKQQYPYFMRVCHDDAQQGEALAWFAKYQFNWQRVAILYTSDGYGSGGATKFIEAAFKYNLTILTEQSFPLQSSVDDLTLPLNRIQSSEARVILYFGQKLEFQTVVTKANSLGMFNNVTAWVASDSIWNLDEDEVSVAQRRITRGLIALTPDSGLGTPLFNEFAAGFVGRNMSSFPPMERYSPPTAESISFYNIYAADVANVIANALHNLFEVQSRDNFTQAELFTALKSVDMPGISGRLAFDSNLDRVGLRYILNNIQDGEWKRMGVYTDETYTPIADAGPILWADGTANIPLSQPLPPPPPPPPSSILTADASNAILAVSSICLIIIVGNLVGLWFARTSRVFHAASPTMLSLVLIGGALVCSSVFISGLDQTVARCTIRQWFFNIGFQASFGAMLLKTYRVHKIFNNAKLQVFTMNDALLFQALGVCIVFDVIILALRSGISPYHIDENNVCSFESGQPQTAATALTLILVVSKGIMIAAAAYLSYAVRNLPQLYNESTYLGIAIYNTLLIGAAWIGVRYGIDMSDHPQAVTEFESALMLASTGITLTLIFAPKWYDVYQAEKQRAFFNDIRRRAKKGTSRSAGKAAADEHGRGPAMAGAAAAAMVSSASTRSGTSVVGTGPAPVKLIAINKNPTPIPSSPQVGGGGTAVELDGAPQSQIEVESLLQTVLTDQTKRLEGTFKQIELLQNSINEKKKEALQVTDIIFQVQCELDFFREVGAGLSKEEVAALFKGRLQEFHVIPDSVSTKSIIGGAAAAASAVGSGGIGNSKSPSGSLSAAYAAVKTSMDAKNALPRGSISQGRSSSQGTFARPGSAGMSSRMSGGSVASHRPLPLTRIPASARKMSFPSTTQMSLTRPPLQQAVIVNDPPSPSTTTAPATTTPSQSPTPIDDPLAPYRLAPLPPFNVSLTPPHESGELISSHSNVEESAAAIAPPVPMVNVSRTDGAGMTVTSNSTSGPQTIPISSNDISVTMVRHSEPTASSSIPRSPSVPLPNDSSASFISNGRHRIRVHIGPSPPMSETASAE